MNGSIKYIGGRSYTGDNILIYTLHVSQIAAKATEKDLQDYFGKFGEVENVSIITKKKNSNRSNETLRYAFIRFKEPEPAASALKTPIHNLFEHNMTVMCADKWKQPFQQNVTQVESENMIVDKSPSDNYSILNLNDDCLFEIFKNLSFNDQIKMSKLCTRLEDIFELIYKTSKSLDMDLAQGLTSILDFRYGLQKMGHHIEHISINSGIIITRFIDIVALFCPNLLNLKLKYFVFKHNYAFRQISTNLQHIKHVDLQSCSINDYMTKLLSQIPTIEYLDLTRNYDITGRHLHKFHNLKHLILDFCLKIKSKYFIDMCKNVTKLTELSIRRCERLNNAAFESMVENLNDLKSLTITTSYHTSRFYKISQLKSLKHLTINHSTSLSDILYDKLAEHKSNQLETLKVTNFTLNVSKARSIKELIKLKQIDLPFAENLNKYFLNNLAKSSNLKILNIPGCQMDLDDILYIIRYSSNIEVIDISKKKYVFDETFFTKTIEILKQKQRFGPLTIQIGDTVIKDYAKSNQIIQQNAVLLKINTNPTSYVMETSDDAFDMVQSYFYPRSNNDENDYEYYDLPSDFDLDTDDDDDHDDFDVSELNYDPIYDYDSEVEDEYMDDALFTMDFEHEHVYYFPETVC